MKSVKLEKSVERHNIIARYENNDDVTIQELLSCRISIICNTSALLKNVVLTLLYLKLKPSEPFDQYPFDPYDDYQDASCISIYPNNIFCLSDEKIARIHMRNFISASTFIKKYKNNK